MPGRLKALRQSLAAYAKTPEIVYSLALIILIPVLIAVNSIVLINLFAKLVDAQAQDKASATAGLLKRTLDQGSTAEVQDQIDQLVRSTTEGDGRMYFLNLEYIVKNPDKEEFVVKASSDPKEVGDVIKPVADNGSSSAEDDPRTFTQLNLSWTERRDIAVAATYNGVPGYQISVLADDASRERQAVIAAFVSTEYIEQLLTEAYIKSGGLLTLTVVITLLLLFVRSRIYRYSTLFRQLQQVDQMKDEFISIASHELRTPLTGIRGNLSMLLEEHDLSDEEQHKLITNAERSADQLTELVADLLDVSRIEQGRLKLQPERLDVSREISAVVENLRPQADQNKLRLEFEPPENDLAATADRNKLRQILINLIGNAIKYTKQGSVSISAEAKGDFVEIDIRDTGIGMTPQDRENLFKKFYRIRNRQTATISGTGLGLWITKSLVEMMGGSIYVDSIEGSGTQVKFTLAKAE